MRRHFLLSALLCSACNVLPRGAECRSLSGQPLTPPPVAAEQRAELEANAEAARVRLAAAPTDRDAAIWYARRLGYLGRFRDAIGVLDRAIDDHPGDPFLLRHRGHRWISLREFGRAAWDFEAAVRACRTTPDEVEPDGMPTAGRPPHSTLHYNVHYHHGLALFLAGDFELAERSWLACLAICGNDESRVAVTHWLWCVRRRLGDVAGAKAVVAPIHERMDVVENVAYLQLCRLYAGALRREDIAERDGSSGSALAFGLAHYDLVHGERARAAAALRQLANSPGWAAFGVIAAEVELQRLPR
jgi:tetratricopeptide (TPR) repeat protein